VTPHPPTPQRETQQQQHNEKEEKAYHFGDDRYVAQQDLGLLVGSSHRRREHLTELAVRSAAVSY
jgi:hypothetical protein